MPVISTIIPIYNTAKYLKRCVDSILNQSFKDIEVILIDDGSTDDSPQICDDYARLDQRVRVLHQQNTGVSQARNLGLDIAKGEFLHFADSDDFIEKGFYEDVMNIVIQNSAQIVCSTMLTENKNGDFTKYNSISDDRLMSREEAVKELLLCRRVSYSLCDKLFKQNVVENLRFYNGIYHNEDFLFCYQAITHSVIIYQTSNSYYRYCLNEGSAVNSPFNNKKMTAIAAQTIVYSDVIKKFPDLINIATTQYFKVIIYLSTQIIKSGYRDKNDRKEVRNLIKNNLYRVLSSDLAMGYKFNALTLAIGWDMLKIVSKRHK